MKIYYILIRMQGGFPCRMQTQQIHEWKNNRLQDLRKIDMVQNHTSRTLAAT